MKTRWGNKLNPDAILNEYPRPQMVRDHFLILNGFWNYAITESSERSTQFDGDILVPFSPESELSGVNRVLTKDQYLWYQREIVLPENFFRDRLLLHFGAIDQMATVYLNGNEIGSHFGGFTSFSLDITAAWLKNDRNIIAVRVQDSTDFSWNTRGKQRWKPGGIWYSPQSGIWQTVWLESVPSDYIHSIQITPDFDAACVRFFICSKHNLPCLLEISGSEFRFSSNESVTIPMPNFLPWTPDQPYLYSFKAQLAEDKISGYFGMRKFSIDSDSDGQKRFFLNNQPIFLSGLLDQGYYSDGLLTAPSDEAMIYDIQTAKSMGFNLLRKHVKIEPLRWYYHCDRLGMIVWQDMPNGGAAYNDWLISAPVVKNFRINDRHYKWLGRKEKASRDQYYIELDEMIRHLYNVVSIGMWVPFNEGWGQFDAIEVTKRIRITDSSRTIDSASGWFDQLTGDFLSRHVYFKKYRYKKDKLNRAVILSEFGGYSYRIEGHVYSKNNFGYKRLKSEEEFQKAFISLYENEVIPYKMQGLTAAVYTQLSDVEDELNGLLTYDREIIKISPEIVRGINRRLLT